MSKHRKEHHEEEENAERWMLTYSDLITLLLALFIILYSMAKVDEKKFNAVAEQFRQQMGSETSTGAGQYDITAIINASSEATGQGDGTNALSQVYDVLNSYIQQNGLQDQIQLENAENYVRIHIKDTMMFQPDSAALLGDNTEVFQDIEKVIEQVYENVDYITFSGHTADVGDSSLASDQASWRLSTERAITVLNMFIGYGLQQNKLSIEGFAHFMPVADNSTEDGRAQNRRVEITIYKYPAGDYMSAAQRAAVNS